MWIHGFDGSKLSGEQHLEVSYLDQKVGKTLTVFVVSAEEAGVKSSCWSRIDRQTDAEYIVAAAIGEGGGRFTVVFEDETTVKRMPE